MLRLAASAPPAGDREPLRAADDPSPQQRRAVLEWERSFRQATRPVRRSWTVVARALRGGEQSDLRAACRRFRHHLEVAERDRIPVAPDAVLRVHLARAMGRLRLAAHSCGPERRFHLAHQLDKARTSLLEIERRLRRYRPPG